MRASLLFVLLSLSCLAAAAAEARGAPATGAPASTAPAPPFPLDFNDVAKCANAYNDVWFAVDSLKTQSCLNIDAQAALINNAITPVTTPGVTLVGTNIPVAPAYVTTANFTATTPILVATALAARWPDCGEHHVATPFSFATLTTAPNGTTTYAMTTRDVAFTFLQGGGCAVFLNQKDTVCQVAPINVGGGLFRQALIASLNVTGVSVFQVPSTEGCVLWLAAPYDPYPTF